MLEAATRVHQSPGAGAAPRREGRSSKQGRLASVLGDTWTGAGALAKKPQDPILSAASPQATGCYRLQQPARATVGPYSLPACARSTRNLPPRRIRPASSCPALPALQTSPLLSAPRFGSKLKLPSPTLATPSCPRPPAPQRRPKQRPPTAPPHPQTPSLSNRPPSPALHPCSSRPPAPRARRALLPPSDRATTPAPAVLACLSLRAHRAQDIPCSLRSRPADQSPQSPRRVSPRLLPDPPTRKAAYRHHPPRGRP